MQLDVLVPVLMSCFLLWWVSRGMGMTLRIGVAAITLVIVVAILMFERAIS